MPGKILPANHQATLTAAADLAGSYSRVGVAPSGYAAVSAGASAVIGPFDEVRIYNVTNLDWADELYIAQDVDALTTTLSDEYIQDLVGAMFTSNTETGITVDYQDADGTIDVVLVNPALTNAGTANAGSTAVEAGEAIHHKTTLTVSTTLPAIAGGANLAVGKLLYTFPAGAIIVHAAYMSMAITQSDVNIGADTPDIGLGTTIGSGVNALLSDVGAGAENILTGQTANDCTGTAEVKTVADQVLVIEAGDNHTVYFNVADGWAASGDAAAAIAGTVVLDWTFVK